MLNDQEFSGELAPPQQPVDPAKPLVDILSILSAIYNLYYVAHWKSGSPNQYADHELYGRMYEAIPDRLDALAEKIVGAYGTAAIDQVEIAQRVVQWLAKWKIAGSLIDQSLMAEDNLQITIEAVYNLLKNSGNITLGLDDFLMGLASEHEENIYLLNQRANAPSLDETI